MNSVHMSFDRSISPLSGKILGTLPDQHSPAGFTRRAFAAAMATASAALAQDRQLGSLYPTVRALADSAPHELSFLRPEFRSLPQWQQQARSRLLDLMSYSPPRVPPAPQVIHRTERDGYIEEQLTFQTTPESRVPAH